jgi:hypothetical protein
MPIPARTSPPIVTVDAVALPAKAWMADAVRRIHVGSVADAEAARLPGVPG